MPPRPDSQATFLPIFPSSFLAYCPIHFPSLNLLPTARFTSRRSIYLPLPNSLSIAQFTSHCPVYLPSLNLPPIAQFTFHRPIYLPLPNLLPTARFTSYLPGLPLVFPSLPKFIQDGKRAHARIDFSSTSCNNVRISTVHGRLCAVASQCAVEFRSNKKKRKDTWQR